MDISPKFRLFSYEQEVVIPETFAETPAQLVGGWRAESQQLSQGNVVIQANAERILLGLATEPLTGVGIFIGKDGSDYEFRAGDPAANFIHWDGTNLNITGVITGGTIQTATSGQRIVMTSAGLDFHNTSGTLIASLLATSFTKFIDITSPSASPFDGIFIVQSGAGKSGITINCADSGAGSEGIFIQNDGDSSAMRILSNSTSAGIGLEINYQGTASEALKVTSSDSSIVTVGKFIQSGGPGYAVEALGGNDSAREALYVLKDSATIATARFDQTVATSTNFWKVLRLDGASNRNEIWMSNGTAPNGALTGRQGDLCLNGPSGQPFYNNNGGTGWTGM